MEDIIANLIFASNTTYVRGVRGAIEELAISVNEINGVFVASNILLYAATTNVYSDEDEVKQVRKLLTRGKALAQSLKRS